HPAQRVGRGAVDQLLLQRHARPGGERLLRPQPLPRLQRAEDLPQAGAVEHALRRVDLAAQREIELRPRAPLLRRRRPDRQAGIALMHAYVGRSRRDAAAAMRRARRSLNGALRALEHQELDGSLAMGLPGIAWAMAHLDREGLVEADEALGAELDRALLGAVG